MIPAMSQTTCVAWAVILSVLAGAMRASAGDVVAEHGMVATTHKRAVAIGVEILKRGGNAGGAAIAPTAPVGVREPMSNGVGGDLYAIVWDAKSKRLYGLNASGRSPY